MLTKFMGGYTRLIKKKKIQVFLKKAAILLFLFSLSLVFFKQFLSVFATLVIITLASISKIYKHMIHFSIGFELVTFATIIFFYAHGFTFGLVLSLLVLVLSTLVSGRFSRMFIVQAGLYLSMGVLVFILRPIGIVSIGKILIIFYNVFLHLIGILIMQMPPHSTMLNLTVNIASNWIFFSYFSEWLVELL
jgi:hypothetical protein